MLQDAEMSSISGRPPHPTTALWGSRDQRPQGADIMAQGYTARPRTWDFLFVIIQTLGNWKDAQVDAKRITKETCL